MKWRSNSFYSIATAAILVVAVTTLAHLTPPFGSLLILCSAGPILLLTISAIHWSVREKHKPGIIVPIALAIVMAFGIVLCVHTPEQPHTLTQDDLETIHLGMRFEDIAREFGGGDWISGAETFMVAYEVEGETQLVLIFEDGIHLSGATLSHQDGETTIMGSIEQ
jgi:hypothetical protein